MIDIHDRPALLSDDLNRDRPRSGADFAHKTRCHKPTISTRHAILSNHSRPPETLKPQVTRLRNNPKQGSDQTQVVGGSYVIAGLGIIITAHWLIPWFLGSEFYPSVPAARLLGVELSITCITAGLMLNLIAQKRYRPVSRVMIFGVIIHLGLLPPATALFGAVGAAATSAITEACIAFMLWMAVRSNEQRIPKETRVRQVEQKSYPDSSKHL